MFVAVHFETVRKASNEWMNGINQHIWRSHQQCHTSCGEKYSIAWESACLKPLRTNEYIQADAFLDSFYIMICDTLNYHNWLCEDIETVNLDHVIHRHLISIARMDILLLLFLSEDEGRSLARWYFVGWKIWLLYHTRIDRKASVFRQIKPVGILITSYGEQSYHPPRF